MLYYVMLFTINNYNHIQTYIYKQTDRQTVLYSILIMRKSLNINKSFHKQIHVLLWRSVQSSLLFNASSYLLAHIHANMPKVMISFCEI